MKIDVQKLSCLPDSLRHACLRRFSTFNSGIYSDGIAG